jgi:hypothetical protein
MNLSKRQDEPARGHRGLLDELEGLLRHVRVIPLAAPILLLAGFGLGKVTTRALELPASVAVHDPGHVREVPRVQIEALTRSMGALRQDGEKTVDFVTLYRNHVMPVEQVLRRRGVPRTTARKVAWPLVQHSTRRGLDPATVVSVLLVESEGNPHATNATSGARGLMQVMPLWAGHWGACGSNLYAIDDNLCTGTSVLAWYLKTADGNEQRALLGYNGCVRGTVTPDCHLYPIKIERLRAQINREIKAIRQRPVRLLTGG